MASLFSEDMKKPIACGDGVNQANRCRGYRYLHSSDNPSYLPFPQELVRFRGNKILSFVDKTILKWRKCQSVQHTKFSKSSLYLQMCWQCILKQVWTWHHDKMFQCQERSLQKYWLHVTFNYIDVKLTQIFKEFGPIEKDI